MKTLKDFQETGVRFILSKKACLLADEQGLGKTIQAAVAIQRLGQYPVLVLCPASVKINWASEIAEWAGIRNCQIIRKGTDTLIPGVKIVICNYDLLKSKVLHFQLLNFGFKFLVCDEAHYLKSPTAIRSKMVLAKRPRGLARQIGRVLFLSGTPVLNRPIELYAMLHCAAPQLIEPYDDYRKFAFRYCAAWQSPWGLVVKGASRLDELANRIQPFMLRRLKKDVLKELPERTYQMIAFDDGGKAELKWDQLERVKLEDGKHRSELRISAAQKKLPMAIKHIKDLLESNDKIVVFAHHKVILAELWEALKEYKPVGISGDTPQQARQNAIDDFQNDPAYRVFIGQIQASGTGITLTAASTVVFVESPEVPGEILQCVDRCHRIGQTSAVLAQFLVIRNTVEERILKDVVSKLSTIKVIVGDNKTATK